MGQPLSFPVNDADRKLLALHPKWLAAWKEWDLAYDVADVIPRGREQRSVKARCNAANRAQATIQRQIDRIKGYGPVGAIVKLTMERSELRSDENADRACVEIALLARALGLEPYDYVCSNPEETGEPAAAA